MDDLILKTRIDVLMRNLTQVRDVLTTVDERRNDLGHLYEILLSPAPSVRTSLSKLESHLNTIKGRVRDLSERGAEGAKETVALLDGEAGRKGDLVQALEEVQKAREYLSDAQNIIQTILARFTRTDDYIKNTLELTLMLRAGNWINKLTEISDKLQQAEGSPAAELDALRRQAWHDYVSLGYQESRPVFAEYVDFLGGLALRDSGFDRGICQVADELIRACDKRRPRSSPPWESLTIPTSQETMSMTLALIIRMGFPEWTFWALPLTAHALGHVVISNNSDLREYVTGSRDEVDDSLRILLADAFATLAMGPAYACACVLLRLDPFNASADRDGVPADAKRAFVIFEMLEKLSGQDQRAYYDLLKRLKGEWAQALLQANAPVASAEQQPGDGITPDGSPAGWPDEPEGSDDLRRYVDRLWHYFNNNALIAYRSKHWGTTRDALAVIAEALNRHSAADLVLLTNEWDVPADRLKQVRGKIEDELEEVKDIKGTEELRDVLSAAWAYRLMQEPETGNIPLAATILWQQINEVKQDKNKESRSYQGGYRMK